MYNAQLHIQARDLQDSIIVRGIILPMPILMANAITHVSHGLQDCEERLLTPYEIPPK